MILEIIRFILVIQVLSSLPESSWSRSIKICDTVFFVSNSSMSSFSLNFSSSGVSSLLCPHFLHSVFFMRFTTSHFVHLHLNSIFGWYWGFDFNPENELGSGFFSFTGIPSESKALDTFTPFPWNGLIFWTRCGLVFEGSELLIGLIGFTIPSSPVIWAFFSLSDDILDDFCFIHIFSWVWILYAPNFLPQPLHA